MSAFSTRLLAKKRGRFRVRPVLARERYASAHAVTNLLQQLAKSVAETSILERCLVDLALRPMFDALSPPSSGPAEKRHRHSA